VSGAGRAGPGCQTCPPWPLSGPERPETPWCRRARRGPAPRWTLRALLAVLGESARMATGGALAARWRSGGADGAGSGAP
jgi:hypothetical protein